MTRAIWAAAAAAPLAIAAGAQADTYVDATGDTFFGGILDIEQVDVNVVGSDLVFTIDVAADIAATDWGKYMILIDTDNTLGDFSSPNANGWARPIDGPDRGGDFWVGNWVDSGAGSEFYDYNDGTNTWDQPGGSSVVVTDGPNGILDVSFPIALLGPLDGGMIWFDVFSSGGGGGDGAIDSLGNPNQQVADWGDASSANFQKFTIPAPGAAALLGLGGLVAVRRRR